ncbi:MAG: hypothetical protein ABSB96_06780 [Gaiellaceae bacterium]
MKRGKRLKRVVIWLCAGAVALVSALVVAWATGLILHDSSQAASVKQALRDFRAGNYRKSGLNGVYLYATSGNESIDALGGASHTYPATTTVTAIEVPCGVQLDWAALSGRSTTWTFCSTKAGTVLSISDERHSFFGQHDHTTYTCSNRLLLSKEPKSGAVYPFRCRSQQGGSETGEVRILGRVVLQVGDSRVQSLHARTSLTIHGGNSGDETIDWWLDPATSLPVRLVLHSRTGRSMYIGTVHYREDLTLSLLSLRPQR